MLFPILKNVVILVGMKWQLIMVSINISFMSKDVWLSYLFNSRLFPSTVPLFLILITILEKWISQYINKYKYPVCFTMAITGRKKKSTHTKIGNS